MELKQLSIFVENKKGRLSEISKVLADNMVDIRALSIADTTDYGILRLIVDKPSLAMDVLKTHGMTVSLTSVIAIAISDHPGALYEAVKVLSDNDISVEYMYAFLNPTQDTACVILRVEDNAHAIKVFNENGIKLMHSDSIYEM